MKRPMPKTDLTVDDARSKFAGWHFMQEQLTGGEREILYVAEAVLRELDYREESSERCQDALRLGERLRQLRQAEANWPGCAGGDADLSERTLISVEADDVQVAYEDALAALGVTS